MRQQRQQRLLHQVQQAGEHETCYDSCSCFYSCAYGVYSCHAGSNDNCDRLMKNAIETHASYELGSWHG